VAEEEFGGEVEVVEFRRFFNGTFMEKSMEWWSAGPLWWLWAVELLLPLLLWAWW